MNKTFLAALTAFVLTLGSVWAESPSCRDLYSDTWFATDALGRNMPDLSSAGPVKGGQRRVVGIFYVTWHSDIRADLKKPYMADVTKILSTDPDARFDARSPLWTEDCYHWGEPETGYFLSKDEYVIRRDMSMLADAGVDVLIMDVTNGFRYWDECDVIFPVMQKMKEEGNKVPQFCFWAYGGTCITAVQDVYEKIYKAEKYRDLWFYWDGKPLLLYNAKPKVDRKDNNSTHPNPNYDPAAKTDKKNPHYKDPDYTEEFYKDYTAEVRRFFTLRNMWWGHYKAHGKRYVGMEDKWSFGYDMGDSRISRMNPDQLASKHKGKKEEMAVTPAQHSATLVGKSWTRSQGEPQLDDHDMPIPTYVPWLGRTVERPEEYGAYFQERWDDALKADPQFLYLNDWNEWTAVKINETRPFMRRNATYQFVDQYNAEFNRTIQPMKGGYTDNYYMQMAQNIRRYKGVRPFPVLRGSQAMAVDGDFSDWNAVTIDYRDTVGDTFHRDYKGYGGLHYRDESGRNDIVTCKVAVDQDNVYFYAETHDPLTPHTGANWMLLFIDADKNHDTGWNGYDFLVNKEVSGENITTLMRYAPENQDTPWVGLGKLNFRYSGKALELAVPRSLVKLEGDALAFDFHWCDNPHELKDAISLCVGGDSAPNRRFNYRCVWEK